MTTQKDLKRLVRARMEKTGEAYTAARAQLVRKPKAPKPAASAAATSTLASTAPKEFAAVAGMTDAAVKEGTGCAWAKWVKSLDHHGAADLSHRELAALISDTYHTSPWWTQMVAVGYERIRGLRVRGQKRNGTFGMTRSRTYAVDVATLFDAWANARTRKRWLGAEGAKVRTATAPKSIRLQLSDGAIVAVGFIDKGKGKSAVALEQAKLPDREAAERLKQIWSERLDALGTALVSSTPHAGTKA